MIRADLEQRNREVASANQHAMEMQSKLQQQSIQMNDLQKQAFDSAQIVDSERQLINQLELQVDNLNAVNHIYMHTWANDPHH